MTAIAFRAYMSVAMSGVPSEQYTLMRFNRAALNTGSVFYTIGYMWKPPSGIVSLSGQVWLEAGAGGSNATFAAKVIKNAQADGSGGTDVIQGIGSPGVPLGTASIGFSGVDQASGADTYRLFVYATAIDPLVGSTINNNAAHTWFSGVVVT